MEVHPTKEVLAAHALGALPDDGERETVEDHVRVCPACTAQLREFRLAAADLAADRGSEGNADVDLAALERAWAAVKRRIDR